MERRLSAIFAVDMVGYARLMEADETGTLTRQKTHRKELIDPAIDKFHGRVVKETGDGILVEFPSVVEAVHCAVAIQRAVHEREAEIPEDCRITYRVGINLGDIIVEGDDIYGDGVNVAARLEAKSEPGGVCISGTAYDHIHGQSDFSCHFLGEQQLKNISRPVRAYRVDFICDPDEPATQTPLQLPDKPSVAVLPFDNMSGDPDQEYFADGIVEDVITALSRFRSLFVIARNSSFTYKGRAVDIAQVAKDLGVRYVVEGSVRKASGRVRITAQLVDAGIAKHLWAERFEGALEDIFELQDRITEQIVVAIEPEIEARERERARRKPPENLDAWQLVQQGLTYFYHINKTDRMKAIRLFEEAVNVDPDFARAYAHLAYARLTLVTLGYTEDISATIAAAREAAEKVLFLDGHEPLAHYTLGQLHIYAGDIDMAIGEMRTAIAVNPNSAISHFGLGFAYHYGAGQAERALTQYDTALRLSPRDPMRWMTLMLKGSALRLLGNHEEAIANCRQACQFPDKGPFPHMHLAATLAEAGQESEAIASLDRAIELEPNFSTRMIKDRFVGMHEVTLTNLLDGLRKAGLPE